MSNSEGQLLNDVGDVINAVNVNAAGNLTATASVDNQPVTATTSISVGPKASAMLNVFKAITPAIDDGHATFESAVMGCGGLGVERRQVGLEPVDLGLTQLCARRGEIGQRGGSQFHGRWRCGTCIIVGGGICIVSGPYRFSAAHAMMST